MRTKIKLRNFLKLIQGTLNSQFQCCHIILNKPCNRHTVIATPRTVHKNTNVYTPKSPTPRHVAG